METLYSIFLTAVIGIHFLWILFVITGWIYCASSSFWRTVHFGSVIYAVLIETLYFPCPLTYLENALRRAAGWAPYREPFINHYLEKIIYLDAPRWLLIFLVAALFSVTVLRYWRAIHK